MRRRPFLLAIVAPLFLGSGIARAAPPIKVGVRLGEYTHVGIGPGPYTEDNRLFVGGDINFWLGQHFYLDPAIEVVFLQHGNYFTVPVDLCYRWPIGERRRGFVWVGGGPDLVYGSVSGFSRTDLTGDLQAGIGVHAGRAEPYLSLKYVFGSSDFDGSLVLAFGIRF